MNEAQQQQWEVCPPGELAQMVERGRARRRTQLASKVAGASVLLVLCVAGGWMLGSLFGPQADMNYGGIACSDVQPLLEKYRAGTLDVQVSQQVRTHLVHCSRCGDHYRRMARPAHTGAPISLAQRSARSSNPH